MLQASLLSAVILVAALTVAVLGHAGVAALAGILLLTILVLSWRGNEGLRPALLALALGVPLALALIEKATGVSLAGTWQIAPLMLGLFGVVSFQRACRQSRWLSGFVTLFLLFLAWVVLSSLVGRTRPLAGLYQFASDLKPLLLVMLGFVVLCDTRVDGVLRAFTHWLWLPCLALVVFEWLAPRAFFDLFPGRGFARPSIDPTGLLPSRATGLFSHPSMLATTAAWFCVLSAVYGAGATGRRRARHIVAGLIYFSLVITSVQRQELTALALALWLLWMIGTDRLVFSRLVASVAVLVVAGLAFWLVYADNLQQEFRAWGYDPIRAIEHPRAQIMSGAWRVAHESFPFGSGLGTFGGAGAAKFDNSLYLELGFGSYWWFGRQDFLLDTYWPNSLAESGFLGALLLALSYLLLLAHAITAALRAPAGSLAGTYAKACAALCLYTLALSATSPAFQDPRLFLLPAVLVGIAWGAARDPVATA